MEETPERVFVIFPKNLEEENASEGYCLCFDTFGGQNMQIDDQSKKIGQNFKDQKEGHLQMLNWMQENTAKNEWLQPKTIEFRR